MSREREEVERKIRLVLSIVNIGSWRELVVLQNMQEEAVELGYGEIFYLENGRQAFRWLDEKESNQNDPSLSTR